MATYDASVIKSGDTLNLAQLITELEDLPFEVVSNLANTLTNTTSTTPSAIVSQSMTMETDDLAIIVGHLMFSVGDGASSTGNVRLYRDSTALGTTHVITSSISSSSGNVMGYTIVYYDENQSGSISYNLKYALPTGSGPLYSAQSSIIVFRVKKK